jgi:DNA mismatch repair protein MutH
MTDRRPDMSDFDPVSASEDQILEAAAWLEGKTLAQIAGKSPGLRRPSSDKTKNVVADVYEGFFNITKNSDPQADFIAAGIELKSTGLRLLARGGVGRKERLSLKQMGGFDPNEEWETSRLRQKLDDLLIIYYLHSKDMEIGEYQTLKVVRWSPNSEELDLLRADWEFIQGKWARGQDLSGADTRVLEAATKDRGPKPAGGFRRAYALKAGFNHSIYLSAVGELPNQSVAAAFDAVVSEPSGFKSAAEPDTAWVPSASELERRMLQRLREHRCRTVREIRAIAGLKSIHGSAWKSAQASAVRALVGQPARGQSKEALRYGLNVKTVPVSPDAKPWEDMSFPIFRLFDFVSTEWAESDLLHQLNRLIIVPLIRPALRASREDAFLGRAFAWSPDPALLGRVQAVWEDYKRNVVAGRPDDYPRMSDGTPVFVRSHGRDADDTTEGPSRLDVMKRSFWLHPSVVSVAIQESDRDWGCPSAS